MNLILIINVIFVFKEFLGTINNIFLTWADHFFEDLFVTDIKIDIR